MSRKLLLFSALFLSSLIVPTASHGNNIHSKIQSLVKPPPTEGLVALLEPQSRIKNLSYKTLIPGTASRDTLVYIKNDSAKTASRLRENPAVIAFEKNSPIKAHLTDDPMTYRMWSFENKYRRYYPFGPYEKIQGSSEKLPSKKDADIDLRKAWKIEEGSRTTTVAVIDTGIDYYHKDLQTNIWQNAEEIPDNGIDDDGNGFIDDLHGWNFIGNNNEPWDDFGHGTHVAGIIGADTDNHLAVPGINKEVSIMPVKALSSSGMGSNASIEASALYAIASGAKILNFSLGGSKPMPILRHIVKSHPEVLFVFSAGNDGRNVTQAKTRPCLIKLANTLCVAASNAEDNLSSFSNYNKKWVQITAPGEDILSTIPFTTGCPKAPGESCFEKLTWENEESLFQRDWLHGGIGDDWGIKREFNEFFSDTLPTLSDSLGGNYQSNSDSWTISPEKSLSSPSPNCLYTAVAEGHLEKDRDFFSIDLSHDGGDNFYNVETLTGYMQENLGFFEIPFHIIQKRIADGASTSFRLRFRLQSDGQGEFDGVSLILNEILCQGPLANVASLSGTSMSAPHVSGVAALVMSKRRASPALVKKALIKGGDKLLSLQDRAGARLNALGALQKIIRWKRAN